jgi:TolB-like protein/Tfp pilus assembly protein PilF
MKTPAAPEGGDPPRIAVLPLRHAEGETLPRQFSDGLIADIIAELAGLRELAVMSHASTYALRDPRQILSDIGRRLGARYLVIGQLSRNGAQVLLTTDLIVAETGQSIFSHIDHLPAVPSFTDQDRMVGRLVNALVLQVQEVELRRTRGRRRRNLGNYEKLLIGRDIITRLVRARFALAQRLLDDVMQTDPGCGEAHALAAERLGVMAGEFWSTDRARDIAAAERLTRTALIHDSSNIRALLSYAHRRSMTHRDQAGAMRVFQRALNIAPSSALGWALSGLCAAYAGDGAEALRRTLRALDLSPDNRETYKFHHALCVAQYTRGAYHAAADWGLRALAAPASWVGTRGFTAASLAALGRYREAREIAHQMQAASPPGRRIRDVCGTFPIMSRIGAFCTAATWRRPDTRHRRGSARPTVRLIVCAAWAAFRPGR